ncbi:MAG: hypothetical protein ACTHU0_08905 [Kofleriaceae bacterium]
MKVRELIELLERQDGKSEVLLMTAPNWPYEWSIAGLTTRCDMVGGHGGERRVYGAGAAGSDVILVQGEPLRLGDRAAWDVAVR